MNRKVLILLVVFMMFVVSVYGEWITLGMMGEVAYMPDGSGMVLCQQQGNLLKATDLLLFGPQLSTSLGLDVEIMKVLHLDFDTRFVVVPSGMGMINFDPLLVDFKASVYIDIGDILEIGWRHNCWHPVMTYLNPADAWWEGATDEFFIRARGEVSK